MTAKPPTDGSHRITLGALFSQAINGHADSIAVTDGRQTLTYRQLRDQVGRLLTVFDIYGLKPGDGVGLGTKGMTVDFAALYVACQIAGLWTTELPPHLPADVVVDRMHTTAARMLIVDDRTDAARYERLSVDLPDRVVTVADLAERAEEALPSPVTARRGDAYCGIMFTSGSTGKPKPVLIPTGGAGIHATLVMATLRYPVAPVTIVPVTHQLILQFLFVPTLLLGGTVVTVAHYSSPKVMSAAARHRANAVFLTTSDIYDLAQQGDGGDVAEHLQLVFYGGEPMSPSRLAAVTEVFGKIFVGAYGQTETLTAAFLHPEDHDPLRPELLSAAGRPLVGVDIAVWGDTGPVRTGEPGEIVISSPGCMLGYLGMDEATKDTLHNGWVKTGDVGYLDDNGYVHVLDRAKFVFKSAGTTIYPAMIEQSLTRHPDIVRAAVVGVPDLELGHRICAAVTVRPGATLTDTDVRATDSDTAPALHDLRIVDKLPVTPANKVDRPAVLALFARESH